MLDVRDCLSKCYGVDLYLQGLESCAFTNNNVTLNFSVITLILCHSSTGVIEYEIEFHVMYVYIDCQLTSKTWLYLNRVENGELHCQANGELHCQPNGEFHCQPIVNYSELHCQPSGELHCQPNGEFHCQPIVNFNVNLMMNFTVNLVVNFTVNLMVNFTVNLVVNFNVNLMVNSILTQITLHTYFRLTD